jgi:DNA polymerase-3 subunit gamma/tau
MSLYLKFRPKTFKAISGNEAAIESLQQMLKRDFPQVVLFHGESGCGKTTLARIVSSKLGVDIDSPDYIEVNASNNRGIEFFREVVTSMRIKPFVGKKKVILIDEAHKLTSDAMNCLLKPCEDTPSHVYIFICTTEPSKLIKAMLTRCTKVECKPLGIEDMTEVIHRVAKLSKNKVSKEVVELIAENCDGSSREALTKLELVIGLPEKKQIEIAESTLAISNECIELCQHMMSKNSKNWKKIAKILKGLDGEPEGIRRQVMGYANACLLNGSMKAYCILDAFREPFFNTGKPGLTLACFEALNMDED